MELVGLVERDQTLQTISVVLPIIRQWQRLVRATLAIREANGASGTAAAPVVPDLLRVRIMVPRVV